MPLPWHAPDGSRYRLACEVFDCKPSKGSESSQTIPKNIGKKYGYLDAQILNNTDSDVFFFFFFCLELLL